MWSASQVPRARNVSWNSGAGAVTSARSTPPTSANRNVRTRPIVISPGPGIRAVHAAIGMMIAMNGVRPRKPADESSPQCSHGLMAGPPSPRYMA